MGASVGGAVGLLLCKLLFLFMRLYLCITLTLCIISWYSGKRCLLCGVCGLGSESI